MRKTQKVEGRGNGAGSDTGKGEADVSRGLGGGDVRGGTFDWPKMTEEGDVMSNVVRARR